MGRILGVCWGLPLKEGAEETWIFSQILLEKEYITCLRIFMCPFTPDYSSVKNLGTIGTGNVRQLGEEKSASFLTLLFQTLHIFLSTVLKGLYHEFILRSQIETFDEASLLS